MVEVADSAVVALQGLRNVGALAAGVTHEMNNCLAALAGYAQVLQSIPPEQLPARNDILGNIREQALRCNLLIGFMSFRWMGPDDNIAVRKCAFQTCRHHIDSKRCTFH